MKDFKVVITFTNEEDAQAFYYSFAKGLRIESRLHDSIAKHSARRSAVCLECELSNGRLAQPLTPQPE